MVYLAFYDSQEHWRFLHSFETKELFSWNSERRNKQIQLKMNIWLLDATKRDDCGGSYRFIKRYGNWVLWQ
jgi:hypothetical protein